MGNTKSIKREIPEKAAKRIPKKKFDELSSCLPKSVCFIDGEDSIGTGSLCEIEDVTHYHCIITCWHVIAPHYIFEAKFKFEGSPYFKLLPEWVGATSYKPQGQGDYIAIELKQAAVAFIKENGLRFLTVKQPQVDEQVVVFGYGEADITNPEMDIGYGAIQSINGFTLKYYAATAPGTSGSPLVQWTGEAIGYRRYIAAEGMKEKHLQQY